MACSTGTPPAQTPASQQTPTAAATPPPGQATPPPGQATPTLQPNTGDNESRARALVPPGSTQLSESSFGNAFQLTLSSTQSIEQLGAFWTQAIPAAGMQETGRFTAEGSLTIAFTNPDGGIVAAPDPSTGTVTIVISVGTS